MERLKLSRPDYSFFFPFKNSNPFAPFQSSSISSVLHDFSKTTKPSESILIS